MTKRGKGSKKLTRLRANIGKTLAKGRKPEKMKKSDWASSPSASTQNVGLTTLPSRFRE